MVMVIQLDYIFFLLRFSETIISIICIYIFFKSPRGESNEMIDMKISRLYLLNL